MTDHDTDTRTTDEPGGFTRREALKVSGLALGGLALGTLGELVADAAQADGQCRPDATDCCPEGPRSSFADKAKSQRYSYYDSLPPFYPFGSSTPIYTGKGSTIVPLGPTEMRITFLGSSDPPRTLAQRMMSIFVEVGWDSSRGQPLDQFVFDCGSGVCANYGAMNIGFGRMDKVFLTHLHADHMSDLVHIYCFGPPADRKSPLWVWGPGPSWVPNPAYTDTNGQPQYYQDGTTVFCQHLRELCRWHSESMGFETSAYIGYTPPSREDWGLPHNAQPVGGDANNDGYSIIPVELALENWPSDNLVAYNNSTTGVKISYFPVIHTRKGAIGYKLEWQGLTMIFTGDTKPESVSLQQAINSAKGVDVFIHEMVPPPQVWAMKSANLPKLPAEDSPSVKTMVTVENSSHTSQGAFGYLLSQISPRPRLTVATHFPTADDTVECALASVKAHCKVYQGNQRPAGAADAARITWSFDRMVITVSKDRILEQKGVVEQFGFGPNYQAPPGTDVYGNGFLAPKYSCIETNKPVGDPYAQIDTTTEIEPCGGSYGEGCHYNSDGY
ncbi:hypothetical protein [uncultured Thiodictyon sp.]|jgi:ribonuclease Z|uniref:hypothetical protein n=1 Tax=uncultured Thiodictyon sp. TaxID=1846217 RepID=UPI0025F445DB|nr:hypothetical protein [uncultured Thiodictyon sp.]